MRAAITFALLALAAAAATNWDAAGNAWWKNVEYLASDGLQGRNVGSPGFDKAATYVAGQFERAGLKPAGVGNYFQPVEFNETSLDAAKSSLALVRDGKTTPLDIPGEAQLGYSAESAPTIKAPVVFAGYGLVIPEAHHDDLQGLPVKGAIVAFLTGGPNAIDGNLRSHYSSGEERWKALRAAGAVGTISIANPKSMEIPWARQSLSYGRPRMALANSKANAGLKFNASWNPDKADDLLAGSGHTFAEILDAANHQKPLPHFALQSSISAVVLTSRKPVHSKNVIGLRPGTDPKLKLKNEYVVVSAHLDHLGEGKPVNGDGIYNGAMDDASGVASVIEIAKTLAARKTETARSIIFLAVTGEEKGEVGSGFFAEHPSLQGTIVADLNMDMFLPLFPLKWLEVQGLNESTLGADVHAVAEAAGVKVQADKEPNRNRFIRSDQYSFIKKGVPSLAFKFGYIPGGPEEKIFNAWYTERYHGVSDDLNQPVDRPAAAQFNDILLNLAVRVANAPQRPAWEPNSFFKRFAAKTE
ncbi:MAG TPA: M28 family metallopeptidase [Bryobacteraceae bacterium]